jgi:hypothetical protein
VGAAAIEAVIGVAIEVATEAAIGAATEAAVEVAACHTHQEARSLDLWIRVELQRPCCLAFASLAPSGVDNRHI